jgi:hypothetical protein
MAKLTKAQQAFYLEILRQTIDDIRKKVHLSGCKDFHECPELCNCAYWNKKTRPLSIETAVAWQCMKYLEYCKNAFFIRVSVIEEVKNFLNTIDETSKKISNNYRNIKLSSRSIIRYLLSFISNYK